MDSEIACLLMAQLAPVIHTPIGDANGWLVAAIVAMFASETAAITWFVRVRLPSDEARNLHYFDMHMIRLDALNTIHENTLKAMRDEFNIERFDQYKRFESSLSTMHVNTVEANVLVRDELIVFRETIGKCLDSVDSSLRMLNDGIRNPK